MAVRRTGWSGADDLELVGAARRAPEAFTELYRRHVQRVFAFAWRRTGHRETAEDVVATTFEKAWARLDTFDHRRGRFVNWVLGIAAHELAEQHRRSERDRRDRTVAAAYALSQQDQDDPEVLGTRADDDATILAALDSLPARYQLVLSLRHLEGLSPSETAAALGMSSSVLAITSHRARRALHKALRALERDDEGAGL